jgi:uncharacterized membrane protein
VVTASRGQSSEPKVLQFKKSIIIDRAAPELFVAWRNLDVLPDLMTHLKSVTRIGERRSRWVMRGPRGTGVEWEAVITAEEEDRLIRWESVSGSEIERAGSVRFIPAPGRRGTMVIVELEFRPPGDGEARCSRVCSGSRTRRSCSTCIVSSSSWRPA